MAILRRTVIAGSGFAAALVAGQAPEFAQQYRQRLGGALDELRSIVEQFDADASRSGLARDEALALYDGSAETFLRDRGVSMRTVIERYERLSEQARRMGETLPALRPLTIAQGYDRRVLEGAWREFEPAVPMTAHGLGWTAAGFALGTLIAAMLARLFRRRRPAYR